MRLSARDGGLWVLLIAGAWSACRSFNPAFVKEHSLDGGPGAGGAGGRDGGPGGSTAPDGRSPEVWDAPGQDLLAGPDGLLAGPDGLLPDPDGLLPDPDGLLPDPNGLLDLRPPDTSPVSAVGCADGTREGFTDIARFPTIAACGAMWPTLWMRAPRTGKPCGNSLPQASLCGSPADGCALGWHVCGNSPDGSGDVRSRVSQQACAQVRGRFAGALGDRSCADCPEGTGSSGAICCGTSCVNQNGDCIWPGATMWVGLLDGYANKCSANTQLRPNADWGVLCCRD